MAEKRNPPKYKPCPKRAIKPPAVPPRHLTPERIRAAVIAVVGKGG